MVIKIAETTLAEQKLDVEEKYPQDISSKFKQKKTIDVTIYVDKTRPPQQFLGINEHGYDFSERVLFGDIIGILQGNGFEKLPIDSTYLERNYNPNILESKIDIFSIKENELNEILQSVNYIKNVELYQKA